MKGSLGQYCTVLYCTVLYWTVLCRDKLVMPKLVINCGNDEFFNNDNARYWWGDISTQYLHNIYIISTQYLHNIYAGSTTSSFLLVQHSAVSDSGRYSCQPSLGNTAATTVHVIRSKIIVTPTFRPVSGKSIKIVTFFTFDVFPKRSLTGPWFLTGH